MTMSGDLLSLAILKTLSKSAAFIPETWRQAIPQVTEYLPVLAALVGSEHPLTLSYQQGLDYIREHQHTFGEAFSQEPGVRDRFAPSITDLLFSWESAELDGGAVETRTPRGASEFQTRVRQPNPL